ncbi:iron-containing alcohol dehydrogenase [Parasutterella secunda]|uniref:iron-containing alcohol dehydrogenase n=1 Tax=Parasutterella secunda TaxID=626947 RepID=UPI002012D84F|nr:iron-containing alcohol dehydrogenase [Parasutterella secunda]MCL1596382.1 iron-containing alcohol dehydrogenase [Parasutterella secunda]
MLNFNYCNPTRILFGRDEHKKLGEALKKENIGKVLIVYGGGSALKNGTVSAVQTSLEEVGIEYFTIGGVRANPTLDFAAKVKKIAVDSQVDALLAIGGGSVIDTCKVAAAWAKYDGDAWDFFTKGVAITDAIPVACVLTIPAAGSEQSIRMVINHNGLKLGTASEKIRPLISVVNPELFFTLPENQIAAGVVDMISHIFERYFTNTEHVEFVSGQAEAAIRTAMEMGSKLLENHSDYDAWCQVAMVGSWAHNGYYGLGQVEDWACHAMEHELSAFDPAITHGAGLAVITPAWLRYVAEVNPARMQRFAKNVMGVETLEEGIAKLQAFYAAMKMPTKLSDFGLTQEALEACAASACARTGTIGQFKKLTSEDVLAIYKSVF